MSLAFLWCDMVQKIGTKENGERNDKVGHVNMFVAKPGQSDNIPRKGTSNAFDVLLGCARPAAGRARWRIAGREMANRRTREVVV